MHSFPTAGLPEPYVFSCAFTGSVKGGGLLHIEESFLKKSVTLVYIFLKSPRNASHTAVQVGLCAVAPPGQPPPTRVQSGGFPLEPEVPRCRDAVSGGLWQGGGSSLSLRSSPAFSCDSSRSAFGLIFPTPLGAHVPCTGNESGWPTAPCTSLTSTLSLGNYANYRTGAQD